jgi:hypothetical protein
VSQRRTWVAEPSGGQPDHSMMSPTSVRAWCAAPPRPGAPGRLDPRVARVRIRLWIVPSGQPVLGGGSEREAGLVNEDRAPRCLFGRRLASRHLAAVVCDVAARRVTKILVTARSPRTDQGAMSIRAAGYLRLSGWWSPPGRAARRLGLDQTGGAISPYLLGGVSSSLP